MTIKPYKHAVYAVYKIISAILIILFPALLLYTAYADYI